MATLPSRTSSTSNESRGSAKLATPRYSLRPANRWVTRRRTIVSRRPPTPPADSATRWGLRPSPPIAIASGATSRSTTSEARPQTDVSCQKFPGRRRDVGRAIPSGFRLTLPGFRDRPATPGRCPAASRKARPTSAKLTHSNRFQDASTLARLGLRPVWRCASACAPDTAA